MNKIQIQQRFQSIKNQIPDFIKLIAVTKRQNIESIKTLLEIGHNCFGESYVQEAITKIIALRDYKIEWHFIGPIQANKTKLIAENFSWVHSIDRLKIAQRLNDQRPKELPPLNVCIQVNISNEKTKQGISLTELPSLAKTIQALSNLKLRGLMTIPKFTEDLSKQRENFHKLQIAFQELKNSGFDLDTLSMGMSNDFGAAIAEGSTMIRIGSAIFGERKKEMII